MRTLIMMFLMIFTLNLAAAEDAEFRFEQTPTSESLVQMPSREAIDLAEDTQAGTWRYAGSDEYVFTTITAITRLDGANQNFAFMAATGCHLQTNHRVTISTTETMLVDNKVASNFPGETWYERHRGISLTTGFDYSTSATYRDLTISESWQGNLSSAPLPVWHRQVVIRDKDGAIIYFRDHIQQSLK